MQEKYYKYAKLLLTKGLCINENQPLVINAPITTIDFIRVLTTIACQLGVKDIYYDWYDDELKHTQLKYYDEKDIKKSLFWNKEIHDVYAKKNAAFLFLISSNDNIMDDIPTNKLKLASSTSLSTRSHYRKLQENNQISWCIAAVSTEEWGHLLFPKSSNPTEELWNLIFDICMINEKDPISMWEEKMLNCKNHCHQLNNLNIKTLHYTNSLGTNLTIELPYQAIWCGGSSIINGQEPIVNIPTEEVFTTPNKYKTTGIVYCSKPLVHSGIVITGIMLEFKNGKVINYDAKTGKEELKNILEYDEESSLLGEVALVPYNSRISTTNILFYETLYDENASCHIALGRGFKECLTNGHKLTNSQLEQSGYNKSNNHVDIMIGTKDLTIIATTYNNEKIQLFKDGNFSI